MSHIVFTEEHVWLRVEGDEVVVGITTYAAEQLGDIVFVELPSEGVTVSKDDEAVVIESVKAASDVLAPVDGEITEVNTPVSDNPAMVNDDPQGDAWLYTMTLSDPSQLEDFMDEAGYQKYIA